MACYQFWTLLNFRKNCICSSILCSSLQCPTRVVINFKNCPFWATWSAIINDHQRSSSAQITSNNLEYPEWLPKCGPSNLAPALILGLKNPMFVRLNISIFVVSKLQDEREQKQTNTIHRQFNMAMATQRKKNMRTWHLCSLNMRIFQPWHTDFRSCASLLWRESPQQGVSHIHINLSLGQNGAQSQRDAFVVVTRYAHCTHTKSMPSCWSRCHIC